MSMGEKSNFRKGCLRMLKYFFVIYEEDMYDFAHDQSKNKFIKYLEFSARCELSNRNEKNARYFKRK
jgi:hypothetical protein